MGSVLRAEQTRNDILAAGVRLFSLHGYHNTSMGDLLAAVSLSKGAFYHHFKSKEEMALAVLERVRESYSREVVTAVQHTTERGRRFGVLLERLSHLNGSGEWDCCLLLSRLVQEMSEREGTLAEQVRDVVSWLIDFAAEVIADGQEAGYLRNDLAARDLAELFVSVLFGSVAGQELPGDSFAVEKVLAQLGTLMRHRGQ